MVAKPSNLCLSVSAHLPATRIFRGLPKFDTTDRRRGYSRVIVLSAPSFCYLSASSVTDLQDIVLASQYRRNYISGSFIFLQRQTPRLTLVTYPRTPCSRPRHIRYHNSTSPDDTLPSQD